MVVPRKSRALGCIQMLFVAGLLTSLAVSSGCQTPEGTGAAAGGLLGAGIGGLASRCPGGALLGAAIGAGAGTLAGAGVEAAQNRKAQRNAQAAAATAVANAPTLNDIVNMTQNAVPTPQIIEQIRTSGVIYRLSADDVIALNRQGVDPRVIQALQDTALRPPRPVYTAPPVVVQQPVVEYVGPGPVVGVGYGYGRWR